MTAWMTASSWMRIWRHDEGPVGEQQLTDVCCLAGRYLAETAMSAENEGVAALPGKLNPDGLGLCIF